MNLIFIYQFKVFYIKKIIIQEIQKIKDMYEPIIKQHKEGIKFLKQNPFLKNLKEYKNFEN